MREILFRGKRTDNGEWVKGYYEKKPSGKTYILNRCIAPPDGDPMWRKVLIEHEVAEETICQYTGLTDKNGKKIFEGDIVDYEDEAPGQHEYHDSLIINRGVIEYSEGCFYWTNAVNANLQDSVYKGVADCEVVGNIFDNPELLEEV